MRQESMDTSEKYADRVTPEHRMAMEAIGMFGMMLGPHREQFEALLKAERDMHNFGGLIDPTLYKDMIYSQNFRQQIRLVKAVLSFLDEIDAVKKEIG